jgi:soluble lytic murein transglycosylase-like protein
LKNCTLSAAWLTALLLVSAGAQASQLCTWETAAARYGVNASVLYAIAQQESSLNPAAINLNTDGSYDFGLTQINSLWLPHLSKFGITATHLMDPCTNLNVGAYILSLSMQRYGNTWQAIGAYHSSTPWRRDQYALSIYRRLGRLPARVKNQPSNDPTATNPGCCSPN